MYSKTYWGAQRSTFLVDAEGRVAHVIPKVSPRTHGEVVLAALNGVSSLAATGVIDQEGQAEALSVAPKWPPVAQTSAIEARAVAVLPGLVEVVLQIEVWAEPWDQLLEDFEESRQDLRLQRDGDLANELAVADLLRDLDDGCAGCALRRWGRGGSRLRRAGRA